MKKLEISLSPFIDKDASKTSVSSVIVRPSKSLADLKPRTRQIRRFSLESLWLAQCPETSSDGEQTWLEAHKYTLLYLFALLFYFLTLFLLVSGFLQLRCKTFDLLKLMFFLSNTMNFGQKIK